MGPKITVDSATMMNKALEIIESRWLFGLSGGADRSGDSSAVDRAFVRGVRRRLGDRPTESAGYEAADPVRAGLSGPAARGGRAAGLAAARGGWSSSRPMWSGSRRWSWGRTCAKAGGTSGAVLNAANEAAVEAFLDGELHFTEIVPACRSVLEAHHFEPNPTLEQLVELDRWARAGGDAVGMCVN